MGPAVPVLAKNQNKTKELLNDLWKTHGNFSYTNNFDDVMKPLEDKADHLDEKCSDLDSDCLDYSKKIVRSVQALYVLARQYPLSPGLHLGYHLNRIFNEK